MTEHVHVLGQGFNIAHMEEYIWCVKCNKKWSKAEVTAIINAAEQLSAEDARWAAESIRSDWETPGWTGKSRRIYGVLLAYAKAREG